MSKSTETTNDRVPRVLVRFGKHPSSVGKHPSIVGKHPSIVGKHPSSVGKHPSSVGKHPSSVGKHPSSVGKRGGVAEALPRRTGALPRRCRRLSGGGWVWGLDGLVYYMKHLVRCLSYTSPTIATYKMRIIPAQHL